LVHHKQFSKFIDFSKHVTRGVDTFFKTLTKLASRPVFLLAKRKQLAKNIEKVSERKKPSPNWRVGLYFYSPFLNSTRIWQVGE
jgi:hypothetical protein